MAAADSDFEDGDDLDLAPGGDEFTDDDDELDTEQFADADDGDDDGVQEDQDEVKADSEQSDRELEAARARAAELEQRLARAEEQLTASAKARRDLEISDLKSKEADLEKRRMAALDEDNTEEFNTLDRELREAAIARVTLEREPVAKPQPKQPKPADSFNEFVEQLAPAAKSWVQRNRGWFDPDSEEYDSVKARRAEKLATQLESRYKRNDPNLYREIDKQLRRQPGSRSRVAGVSRGTGVSKTNRKGNAPPSRSEAATMRRYGLDKDNPVHLREFRNRDQALT